MICPSCSHDNIAGSEICEECGHDLAGLDLPSPSTGLQRHFLEDTLGELPMDHPANLSINASVADAIEAMRAHGVGCVLVFDQDRLAGIFTERDLLTKLAVEQQDLHKLGLREVMTPEPALLHEVDTIAYALNRMSVGGFRHVPVVRSDRPIGVVSIRDVLHYICTKLA